MAVDLRSRLRKQAEARFADRATQRAAGLPKPVEHQGLSRSPLGTEFAPEPKAPQQGLDADLLDQLRQYLEANYMQQAPLQEDFLGGGRFSGGGVERDPFAWLTQQR